MTDETQAPLPARPAPKDPPQLRSVHADRSFATLRTIVALILREMSTSYGKSPGGYLWAILEPVGAIAILTAIFSLGFRSPSIGVNFPIFYATGIVPFMMFNDIAGKVASALNYSRALLAYPSVTFVDAMVARFVVNMMTQISVAYIVFFGILFMFDTRTSPDLPTIMLAFVMTGTLAFGIGAFNCFMFSILPIWQQVWSIFTRPLFILSGVLFIYDKVPEPYAWYMWFNPLVHIVGTMRSGFYFNYDAAYISHAYVFGVALSFMLVGLVFLRRYHKHLLNR
ncbi:ABC transporter permease [Thalassorhabdomicrobium marinisediminis]|uniref:ABC transporter permease n=1 Tax=Thalassorhabdomicrobium marinisediminis TaxID=2170577 RepID=UPI0024907439|nr:ABC transporter permease [Thalassorhabdomicrobium marinisediminis]